MNNDLLNKLFVGVQHGLPHHLISRLIGLLAKTSNSNIKQQFIQRFAEHYKVNMEEAEHPDLDSYTCFNDFFTRALKPGSRPIDTTPNSIISPADGAISQIGDITHESIIQAKGRHYSALTLLGGNPDDVVPFLDGQFATIYLAPKDYHRLHMPISGRLTKMLHVPGRLFSVNPVTAEGVPDLFARNERVVALFETEIGPMALVLVGAMIVASIETVWHGVVTPPTRRKVQSWSYNDQTITLEKGEEMGRFKLGSTIVVLFPKEAIRWESEIQPEHTVKMGSSIGQMM
ncbi:MAG: archaetidylserine decarboxylase [Gammaproteobacteria bacterium]|nr:archaetidylserine decarboxylase [Gammaproteobacteria bacterium]